MWWNHKCYKDCINKCDKYDKYFIDNLTNTISINVTSIASINSDDKNVEWGKIIHIYSYFYACYFISNYMLVVIISFIFIRWCYDF